MKKLGINEDLKGIEEIIIVKAFIEQFGVETKDLSISQMIVIKFAIKKALVRELDEINSNLEL